MELENVLPIQTAVDQQDQTAFVGRLMSKWHLVFDERDDFAP
jgi:hypothetical protein